MDLPFKKNSHVKLVEIIASGMQTAGTLKNYLELGARSGNCFNVIAPMAKAAYAVEMRQEFFEALKHNTNLNWFAMKTDEFFAKLNSDIMFDLIFIDADHHSESSLKDFKNAIAHLREGGLILMHDTYPPNKDFIEEGCHDCYMTAKYIRKNYKANCEIVTLPFFYGISIIRKCKASNHLTWNIKNG